jgi:hypothetical protein
MKKHIGIWTIAVAAIVLLAGVFYSHSAAAIPEWRIQVIDEKGMPMVGVDVHQEWNNLEADGITSADARKTDTEGWVVLPTRRIRDSGALRIQDYFSARQKGRKSLLSTHAFVCWQGQTGELRWDDLLREPPRRLQLHKGSCGYD